MQGVCSAYSAYSHGAVNQVFLFASSSATSSALYASTLGSPSAGMGLGWVVDMTIDLIRR